MTADTRRIWVRAFLAALISGAAGGVTNGFAAMGIAPDHFNMVDWGPLAKLVIASILCNALIGVAMFLQKSPLPAAE